MSITARLSEWPASRVTDLLQNAGPREVEKALSRETLTLADFAALASNAAAPYLEAMAQKAQALTRRHFGSTVLLFTPLYLSDYCENQCTYCSFAAHQHLDRHQLSLTQVEAEAEAIHKTGLRHILLLTGEAPHRAGLSYIRDAVLRLKPLFPGIAIEIYPMDAEGYGALIDAGADALTLYQETYDRKLYADYHPKGPKSDFDFRLLAPERALSRGMRSVTLGALLGLNDPLVDAFYTALHLETLQDAWPEADIALAPPRMRPVVSGFTAPFPVSDPLFVRLILAFRLFRPWTGITLSTREPRAMRDALVPLAITKMSAGVSTAVGGRSHETDTTTVQFEIADNRSVDEVKADMARLGIQTVMVDWDHRLVRA